MYKLCAPALIYIIFSLTHIIIDTFKGLYNTAFFKFIISILITFLLDMLCKSGMGIISWFIVFIPFIFMTFIVTILLYVFGLDIATGTLNLQCSNPNPNPTNSGNLIFSTTTDIINNSNSNSNSNSNTVPVQTQIYNQGISNTSIAPTLASTDPAYESFTTK
jgi:predicted PurR-regulated permease PerM